MPSDEWLGRKRRQWGGILVGHVYVAPDQGFINSKTLNTNCKQDQEFLNKLNSMVGQEDTYRLWNNGCRTFSEIMFNEAEETYGPQK